MDRLNSKGMDQLKTSLMVPTGYIYLQFSLHNLCFGKVGLPHKEQDSFFESHFLHNIPNVLFGATPSPHQPKKECGLFIFKELIMKISITNSEIQIRRTHLLKYCISLTFVEHQYLPKVSWSFVHSLYSKSGSVSNVNGKIQCFCSFELSSFTRHCKILLTFEIRFRNMTKETMKHFMFLIKCFVFVVAGCNWFLSRVTID